MLVKNTISIQKINIKYQKRGNGVHRLRRLDFNEHNEIESCDSSMWYREYIFICRIFNIHVRKLECNRDERMNWRTGWTGKNLEPTPDRTGFTYNRAGSQFQCF